MTWTRQLRYIFMASLLMVAYHYLSSYHAPTGLHWDKISGKSSSSNPPLSSLQQCQSSDYPNTSYELANATFVMLIRNSDLDGTISSIRALEDRFNSKFGYPYVLLNNEPFTDEFKRRVSVLIRSEVQFGLIPKEHWSQPDWIDEENAAKARKQMVATNVKYGGSVSYRNMCRFNSGFFYRHELLQKYKWYWRVEPNVKFYCDINDDPFRYMEENQKVYGFTITVYEISATIRSLWSTVTDFIENHPEYIATDNAMGFISDNNGKTYNRCHFWSNFEIADMDFWRGEAYTAFFEHLDSKGGFYYERWGDAPVHSIAAALFLRRDQVHFFEEIGYQHDDWGHCPLPDDIWEKGRCSCSQKGSFGSDYDPSSCKPRWDKFMNSQ
ncbi:glycosyltransferase family 15 protein [Lentinula aff. detonsa]|uniref:Glycosyltransferase family 15 protein n=1 Tax=Lentinula aff. detonsa TaxID=2804958 RepID=A0AA38NJH3_9AGAR|nr:glycosyltransferase family 15 protein [Lentinula aff. detonsa]KAJ3800633.1 glycosyltransferase family 15 protein [Lentinula aff. detonsa]